MNQKSLQLPFTLMMTVFHLVPTVQLSASWMMTVSDIITYSQMCDHIAHYLYRLKHWMLDAQCHTFRFLSILLQVLQLVYSKVISW